MDTDTCPSCGANNPKDALHCWQCYASFATASARGPSLLRALEPRAIHSLPAPEHGPGKKGLPQLQLGLLIRLALTGALIFGGWWVWKTYFGGFPFPDQVAGAPRLDSSAVETQTDVVEAVFKAMHLRTEMVVYGFDEAEPDYAVLSLDFPDDPIDAVLAGGRANEFVSMDLTEHELTCGSSTGPFPSYCLWPENEETAVMVMASRTSLSELQRIAEQIRAEASN